MPNSNLGNYIHKIYLNHKYLNKFQFLRWFQSSQKEDQQHVFPLGSKALRKMTVQMSCSSLTMKILIMTIRKIVSMVALTDSSVFQYKSIKKDIRISSVQFSHSVVSDSLRPHESQHARPPCPSDVHIGNYKLKASLFR